MACTPKSRTKTKVLHDGRKIMWLRGNDDKRRDVLLVPSPRRGRNLCEFELCDAAATAILSERGFSTCPTTPGGQRPSIVSKVRVFSRKTINCCTRRQIAIRSRLLFYRFCRALQCRCYNVFLFYLFMKIPGSGLL